MGPSDETPQSGRAYGIFRFNGLCRFSGWSRMASGKVKADRTAENVNNRKTKPTQSDEDCHKSYCGSTLNSFGASVGSKSKATIRGCFLFAAGCRDRDCRTGSRESSGWRARQAKLGIGQNKATGSQLDCSLIFSLTMSYIMRSEKSRGGQTQSSRYLHGRSGARAGGRSSCRPWIWLLSSSLGSCVPLVRRMILRAFKSEFVSMPPLDPRPRRAQLGPASRGQKADARIMSEPWFSGPCTGAY